MKGSHQNFLSGRLFQQLVDSVLDKKQQFLLLPSSWKEEVVQCWDQDQYSAVDCLFLDCGDSQSITPLYPFGALIEQWYGELGEKDCSEILKGREQVLPAAQKIFSFLEKEKNAYPEPWFFHPFFLKSHKDNILDIWMKLWTRLQSKPLVLFLYNLDHSDDMVLRFLAKAMEYQVELPLLVVGFYGQKGEGSEIKEDLRNLYQRARELGCLYEEDQNESQEEGDIPISPGWIHSSWEDLTLEIRNLLSLGCFFQAEKILNLLLESERFPEQVIELKLQLVQCFLGQGQQTRALILLQGLQREEMSQWSASLRCRVLLYFCDAYFYSNKIQEAKKSLALAEQWCHKNPWDRFDYLYHFFQTMGYGDHSFLDQQHFREKFEEFNSLSRELNAPARRVSATINLSVARALFQEFGLEEGRAILEGVIHQAQIMRSYHMLTKGLHTMGIVLSDHREDEEALGYFKKAVKSIEKTQDKEEMIWVLNGAGFFYLNQGNLSSSFRFFYRAIELISDRLTSRIPVQKKGFNLPVFLTELILTLINLTYVSLMSLNLSVGENAIKVALKLMDSFNVKEVPFHSLLEIHLLLGYCLSLQNKESDLTFVEDHLNLYGRSPRGADRLRLRIFDVNRNPNQWAKVKDFIREEVDSHPFPLERSFLLCLLCCNPHFHPQDREEAQQMYKKHLASLPPSSLPAAWEKSVKTGSFKPLFHIPDLEQDIFSAITSSIEQVKAILGLDRKIQEIELINQYQKTIYRLGSKEELTTATEQFLLMHIPSSLVHVLFVKDEEVSSRLRDLPGLRQEMISKISTQAPAQVYDHFLWDQQYYASMVCVPVLLRREFLGLVIVMDFSEDEHTNLDHSFFSFISLLASQLGLAQELIQRKMNLEEGNRELEKEKKKGEDNYQKLRSVQNQLIQSEKMAFLGTLVNGVAQEIQSPLGAIQSLADSLDSLLMPLLERMSLGDYDWSKVENEWSMISDKRSTGLSSSTRETRQRRLALQRLLEEKGISYDMDDVERWVRYRLDRELDVFQFTEQSFNNRLKLMEPFLEIDILSQGLETAVEQVKDTVESLKRFSYVNRSEQGEWFFLDQGLKTVMAIFRHFFQAGVQVKTAFNLKSPIFGWADQLMQVWASLIHSRLTQMSFKGVLEIETWEDEHWAVVRITDDGDPWPGQWLERLFDPLLFLEEEGKDKATGLPLAKKILDSMKGTIEVLQNAMVLGFEVRLPKKPELEEG